MAPPVESCVRKCCYCFPTTIPSGSGCCIICHLTVCLRWEFGFNSIRFRQISSLKDWIEKKKKTISFMATWFWQCRRLHTINHYHHQHYHHHIWRQLMKRTTMQFTNCAVYVCAKLVTTNTYPLMQFSRGVN